MFKQVLFGIRVLDLAPGSSAYAARLLGDVGAEVIKAEPASGDPLRGMPDFERLNVNKYGCTLGGGDVMRLAELADVVIGPAEVIDSLGATKDTLIVVALPADAGAAECIAAAGAVGISLWDRRRTGLGCRIEIRAAATSPLPRTKAEARREPVSTLEGERQVESSPWHLSESPTHIRLPAPALGEHDGYVRELLG